MLPLRYLHNATWFFPARVLLSILFGFIVGLRNWLYDVGILKTFSVNVPVISVGNISVGGSGKTVLVLALIDYFVKQNKSPAVLSRGYGRSTKGLFLVADKTSLLGDPDKSGDEPFLIARKYPGVPVVVSEDRVTGATYLTKNFNPDVLILDDGFQHRRLQRNLDIVILDQPDTTKNRLLPLGTLREPLSNIKRADLVLFSKAGVQKKPAFNLELILEKHILNHTLSYTALSDLSGEYGLFAGLGNPDYFFSSVESLLGSSQSKLTFPDHAKYTPSDLALIERHSCPYWITTEKDFIKLDPLFCQQHHINYIRISTPLPHALLGQLKQNFNL